MFIGGLNWETTDRMYTSRYIRGLACSNLYRNIESLRDYFSQFGQVQECTVMRDGATGRSRGFGFLTFKDAKTVNTVMVKEHYLDNKIVRPQRSLRSSIIKSAFHPPKYSKLIVIPYQDRPQTGHST